MDQRIGPNSPPTPPAGVDPAFVPGLVPPPATAPGAAGAKKAVAAKKAPAGKKAAAEKEAVAAKVPAALRGTPAASTKKSGAAAKTVDAAEADEEAAEAAVAGAGEDAEAAGAATEADAGATGDATGDATGEDVADAEDADAADDVEPEDDGLPVFEASDRRGAITADRAGVTFRLDSEIAEFGWDEIQAVEFDTARFGRRFSVTVYTGPRRWFESDVEAPSRSALKQWATELDAVLDARFEEGAASPESAEAEVAAEV